VKRAKPLFVALTLSAALASNAAVSPDAAAQAKPPAAAPAKAATAAPAGAATPLKEKVTAILGARVHTGDGEPIEDGVVLVAGGKIKAVGKALTPPAGADLVDAKGLVVTAGLTEPLTQVGLREIDLEPSANDETQSHDRDRIRAAYRSADAYNPFSAVIPVQRTGGLTSVGVVPTGSLVSGQSAWADLAGDTATEALAATPLAIHVHLEQGADPQGGSRGAAVRAVREAFDDARAFQKNKAAWERNQSRAFSAGRLDLEALTLALGGAGKKAGTKLPVVFHVNRASLILSALAVAKEHDLTPVIAGGAEAWRVRATLAKAKVPVIVHPFVAGPESFDMLAARDDNAALLHAAGVPVAISSGETHNARKLRQAAGNAVRAGLPHAAAVAAITRAPAEALGMGDRYGTLTPGKVANLVVWSGDPLELSTRVVSVYIRGQKQSLVTRQTQLLQKYRGVPR
jgi:imidazolonepropionase-like amidohydrolase